MSRYVCNALYVAGALAALALAGCTRTASAPAAPQARVVHVETVKYAELEESVHAVGLLTPKDEARLSFKIGGLIESIPVEEGDRVRAGQLLAVLKPAEVNSMLQQARAATAKAQRDLERSKALLADGVATPEQTQDLETAFQVASAAQNSVEFNATHARIVASAGSLVLRKLAEANELVQAGQTVIILGGDARGWIVRVGLADRDVVRVRLGDAARIEFDAWPDRLFDGRISNIASAADAETGTFRVELQLDAGGEPFVQGLVAKVSLSPRAVKQVRVIPIQSLLEANDRKAGVFVFDPATRVVRRANIEIGRAIGSQIEVVAGLQAGNEVVTDGAAFLESGDTVRILSP